MLSHLCEGMHTHKHIHYTNLAYAQVYALCRTWYACTRHMAQAHIPKLAWHTQHVHKILFEIHIQRMCMPMVEQFYLSYLYMSISQFIASSFLPYVFSCRCTRDHPAPKWPWRLPQWDVLNVMYSLRGCIPNVDPSEWTREDRNCYNHCWLWCNQHRD